MGKEQLVAEENPPEAVIAVGYWEDYQKDAAERQREESQLEEVSDGGSVSEVGAVFLSIQ